MVKMLSFSFEQCFGPFTMLLVGGSSERGTFRRFSNQGFLSASVQKYIRGRSALNSVSNRLPCYFSKDPPETDFLNMYLTMFFGVCKFKNTSAMRVIFFFKILKIESKFRRCRKKTETIFFVS